MNAIRHFGIIIMAIIEHTVYSQVEIGGAGCAVCNTDILRSIVWFHIADFEDRPDESQPIHSHTQLFVDPEPGRILQGSSISAPREGGCRPRVLAYKLGR